MMETILNRFKAKYGYLEKYGMSKTENIFEPEHNPAL